MIQTKTAIAYGDRSERFGVIKVEVRPQETTASGTSYLVIDWDTANMNDAWYSKTVFYDNAKKTAVNEYIEANYDLSSLSYAQREWAKLLIALMIDTTNNVFPSGKTIYRCNPSDWEYSPEVLEMFPFLAE